MNYEKIKLKFSLDEFEPYIKKDIMETHYNLIYEDIKNKLNECVYKYNDFKKNRVDELLFNYKFLPDYLKNPALIIGGSFLNHSLFFENLTTSNTIISSNDFMKAIKDAFGSKENLEEILYKTALNVHGSAFVFLSIDTFFNLKIEIGENDNNPLIKHHTPILALDCWEHSYYPQYKAKKKFYYKNLIKLIDWEIVEKRYENAKDAYFTNLSIA